jgi:prepilin signal peptidase PulO-like enzyme (type II secretory pathway)
MLRLHVPEPVLFLLFSVFVTVVGMLGYNSGLGNKRPAFPTILLFTLIILVVFIIIDLDRPKRGIIQVNQDSLHDAVMPLQDYKTEYC